MRFSNLILPGFAALAFGSAPVALAASTSNGSGGAGVTAATRSCSATAGGCAPVAGSPSRPGHPMVPGMRAKIIHGVAYAPADAPLAVQQAIWAGNKIRKKPYIWGGGHGTFVDAGYDCSGSVSFVLHGAHMLTAPFDSSEFMSYGKKGKGQWITIYTNPGHAFVEIAGIRFDTSSEGDPSGTAHRGSGPRWRVTLRDTSGFVARHPRNL